MYHSANAWVIEMQKFLPELAYKHKLRTALSQRVSGMTMTEICLILHMLRKPISLIALLFIQNNS